MAVDNSIYAFSGFTQPDFSILLTNQNQYVFVHFGDYASIYAIMCIIMKVFYIWECHSSPE